MKRSDLLFRIFLILFVFTTVISAQMVPLHDEELKPGARPKFGFFVIESSGGLSDLITQDDPGRSSRKKANEFIETLAAQSGGAAVYPKPANDMLPLAETFCLDCANSL